MALSLPSQDGGDRNQAGRTDTAGGSVADWSEVPRAVDRKLDTQAVLGWTDDQFAELCPRVAPSKSIAPNGEVEILTNPEAPAPPKRAPVGQPIGFRAKNGTTPAYPLRGDTTHAQRGFFSDSVCRVSLDAVHRWRTGRCLDGHARFHRLTTRIARLLCCQHSLRVQ